MEPAARIQHRISGALVAPAVKGGIVSRPALWEQLGNASRVMVVSAPPGSGKTLLLRSWIAERGLADRAAWVAAQDQERDPQRFWVGVTDALRGTAAGSALVRPLTAAPDLDGWAVVERLLADLGWLAALSLSGHPDPERFAEEFCGSERTVAEYLLAEVLERQSEEVRRLLLRTSVLERVNGP